MAKHLTEGLSHPDIFIFAKGLVLTMTVYPDHFMENCYEFKYNPSYSGGIGKPESGVVCGIANLASVLLDFR